MDPHTGVITTAKCLDRESPHVVDNIYTAILHAVDSGKQHMESLEDLHFSIYCKVFFKGFHNQKYVGNFYNKKCKLKLVSYITVTVSFTRVQDP